MYLIFVFRMQCFETVWSVQEKWCNIFSIIVKGLRNYFLCKMMVCWGGGMGMAVAISDPCRSCVTVVLYLKNCTQVVTSTCLLWLMQLSLWQVVFPEMSVFITTEWVAVLLHFQVHICEVPSLNHDKVNSCPYWCAWFTGQLISCWYWCAWFTGQFISCPYWCVSCTLVCLGKCQDSTLNKLWLAVSISIIIRPPISVLFTSALETALSNNLRIT